MVVAILVATVLGAPVIGPSTPVAAQTATALGPTVLLDTPCGPARPLIILRAPDSILAVARLDPRAAAVDPSPTATSSPVPTVGPSPTATTEPSPGATTEPTPDPTPAEPILTIAMRGFGWEPQTDVRVWFDADPGQVAPNAQARSDDFGFFTAVFSVPQPTAERSYTVEARGPAPIEGELRATIGYLAPCPPTISLSPDCGPEASADRDDPEEPYVITVTGAEWGAGFEVILHLVGPEGAVTEPVTAIPGDDGRFTAELRAPAQPAAFYSVEASQGRTERAARTFFRVPCAAPATLVLTPTCDGAGLPSDRYAIQVSGFGFLPGGLVYILFDGSGSTQGFYHSDTVPESGSWGPVLIEPSRRPDGQYGVRAIEVFGRRAAGTISGPISEFRVEAAAVFTVPCPPEPEPEVSIDPPGCDWPLLAGDAERRHAITVRGANYDPGEVVVTFDADRRSSVAQADDTFLGTVLEDGTFTLLITPLARAGPEVPFRIAAEQLDGTEAYNSASATFEVPCERVRPRLNVEPACGSDAAGVAAAYTIDLRGRGYLPGTVQISFDSAGTPEAFTAMAGADGRLSATIRPDGRLPGDYAIRAVQTDGQTTWTDVTTSFAVPCAEPTLTIRPRTGKPGYVAFVQGDGFPANTPIALTWDRGIGEDTATVVTSDAEGSFREGILVFHHDFLGRRMLVAEDAANPDRFDATAPFTVLAGQGSPPTLPLVDPFTGVPGPIVFRR